MKTHAIMVMDSSGSMEPLTADSVGGYNRYLDEQRSVARVGDTWSLILFNTESTVALDQVPIERVPRLTPETYRPLGGTALFDAIRDAVENYKPTADTRVLCVIQTDGHENSSQRTAIEDVRSLVQAREQAGNWTFAFLGAGIDAFQSGRTVGSAHAAGNSLSHAASGAGTREAWQQLSDSSRRYRRAQAPSSRDFFAKQENTPDPAAGRGPEV